jgi:hypothetical protein
MNDQWIPGPPVKPPTWTVNPLPPSNDWNDTEGCSAVSGPAIVDGVVITGVPATVSSLYWQVSLNDGGAPPNFAINHLNGAGAVLGPALSISGADLSATFAGPVYLARDPVEPMEAVTLEYLEAHAAGVEEVPDNQTYGRTLGAWNLVVPASGGGYTGVVTLGAGGAVTSGALQFYGSALLYMPTVAQLQIGGGSLGQVPATDGNGNLSWITPVTGGPYLPIAGGTVTGSLTVNQVLTVQGPNSLVLNAPLNNPRAILAQAAGITRWVMNLGDQTTEGLNNVGANFSLQAYSTTGVSLGTWLSIARADGATTFNGSGVTIAGGLAVNGLLALASPNNLAIYGGAAGQFLQTNGAGILSWAPVPPSGIPDAPTDGTQYGRQSGAWTPISVSGGPPVIIAATPPSAASAGDLWWDSVGGQLYVYFTDANSSQWVIAVNAGSSGAGAGASISVGATPPVNPTVGALWWDAVGAQMYLWFNDGNSSQWVPTTNQMAGVSPASTTVLGGVKVDGTSIKAAADGTISTVLIPMGDNRLINGDMRIDQRNNGASGTVGGYTVDRWGFANTVAGKGAWGRNYGNAVTINPTGFLYYLGFQSSSAYTPLAGDTFVFYQIIEADMIGDCAFGQPNAQPLTLSFWAYSSLTGTFSGSLANYPSPPTRSYPFTFSLPAANTWTKIVIIIPGDTAGTWILSGNAAWGVVHFDLGTGATYRGPAGAWASANYSGATGAVNTVATNGAYFLLTGVKLEIGSVATPFNRQSLAKSLADCQRYYYSGPNEYTSGWADAPLVIYDIRVLKQSMRVAPTITINANHYDNATDIGLGSSTTDDFLVVLTAATTANMAGAWYTYTADAEL